MLSRNDRRRSTNRVMLARVAPISGCKASYESPQSTVSRRRETVIGAPCWRSFIEARITRVSLNGNGLLVLTVDVRLVTVPHCIPRRGVRGRAVGVSDWAADGGIGVNTAGAGPAPRPIWE